MVTRLFLVMLFLALSCFAACAPHPTQMTVAELEALIRPSGNHVQILETTLFPLLTVSTASPKAPAPVLRVYIEGDGMAWRTRRHLSSHPTPTNPIALHLMLADPTADKLYIARPCQFIQSTACKPRYWSTDLYSDVVVTSVSSALSQVAQEKCYRQLELVGYSGGGTLALLLAAQRDDVLSIRTVSGNLDPDAFCRLHHVSPLNGSLNPVDFAEKLQRIPQLHFIGEKDSIVPPEVFSSYRRAFPETSPVHSFLVPDVDHSHGWSERWPELLHNTP